MSVYSDDKLNRLDNLYKKLSKVNDNVEYLAGRVWSDAMERDIEYMDDVANTFTETQEILEEQMKSLQEFIGVEKALKNLLARQKRIREGRE